MASVRNVVWALQMLANEPRIDRYSQRRFELLKPSEQFVPPRVRQSARSCIVSGPCDVHPQEFQDLGVVEVRRVHQLSTTDTLAEFGQTVREGGLC